MLHINIYKVKRAESAENAPVLRQQRQQGTWCRNNQLLLYRAALTGLAAILVNERDKLPWGVLTFHIMERGNGKARRCVIISMPPHCSWGSQPIFVKKPDAWWWTSWSRNGPNLLFLFSAHELWDNTNVSMVLVSHIFHVFHVKVSTAVSWPFTPNYPRNPIP